MWAEITKHLYQFESAVLSGLDEEGYPFSVRCRPYPDTSGPEVLTVWLPPGTPIRPGPASLLCHSHDENLWNLKSFLVRGVLEKRRRRMELRARPVHPWGRHRTDSPP